MLLLSGGEAGRVLGITGAAVRQLVAKGLLAVTAETPAGHRLFAPEEVRRLRDERLKNPPRKRSRREERLANWEKELE